MPQCLAHIILINVDVQVEARGHHKHTKDTNVTLSQMFVISGGFKESGPQRECRCEVSFEEAYLL